MSRNIFTQSSFLASSNESTKINSSFSFFKKKKKIQTRSTCKIKNLLGFANDTFWHVLSWITRYPRKKKKKSISRLQFCLNFCSHIQLFIYVFYIYMYIATMTFFVYLCTRVHLISRKQSWLSCKSFGSIFFPSNLNYCCNDYILCIAYLYFSIQRKLQKKKEKSYCFCYRQLL